MQKWLHVEDLGDGRFKTGYWKISEAAANTAHYLALHNQKNLPSYKQGIIDNYERSDDRTIFYVRETDKPMEWVGNGTGEKGYLWSEN
ncbi:MAG: hypothetical protein AAFO04_09145 [Cyanobacteria bacterium J06592_8]